MTVNKSKYCKEAIDLLYKLIESKPEKHIFNSKEIMDYINKNKKNSILLHLRTLHMRQLRYHIFKRFHRTSMIGSQENIHLYTEYIYVRRDNESIRKQLSAFFSR